MFVTGGFQSCRHAASLAYETDQDIYIVFFTVNGCLNLSLGVAVLFSLAGQSIFSKSCPLLGRRL